MRKLKSKVLMASNSSLNGWVRVGGALVNPLKNESSLNCFIFGEVLDIHGIKIDPKFE
jgi:hypothetical protein